MALFVLITMIGAGCSAAETEENVTDATFGWAGTWVDYSSTMVLTQDGLNVTGTYEDPAEGLVLSIEGVASEDGKILTGTWYEDGKLTFALSEDGTYYNGTFGYGDMDTIEGLDDGWNGTLTTEADPENAWTGEWVSEIGSITFLEQNETAVTGTYGMPVDTEGSLIDGIVSEDGTILTGTWSQTGLFAFTLSDDGKYFNGTYGYGSKDTGADEDWNGVLVE